MNIQKDVPWSSRVLRQTPRSANWPATVINPQLAFIAMAFIFSISEFINKQCLPFSLAHNVHTSTRARTI